MPAFPRSKGLVISSRTPRARLLASARREANSDGSNFSHFGLEGSRGRNELCETKMLRTAACVSDGRTHQDDDSSGADEGVEEAAL